MQTSPAVDWSSDETASEISRDRFGGYVLMELLVALAIIAVIAALALPAGSTTRSPTALRSRALDIAVLMRKVRNEALRSGVSGSVGLDPSSRALESKRGRVKLPDDVSVQVDLYSGDRFVFTPDGRASAGRLTLSSGNLKAVIGVDPMTAAVVIEPF